MVSGQSIGLGTMDRSIIIIRLLLFTFPFHLGGQQLTIVNNCSAGRPLAHNNVSMVSIDGGGRPVGSVAGRPGSIHMLINVSPPLIISKSFGLVSPVQSGRAAVVSLLTRPLSFILNEPDGQRGLVGEMKEAKNSHSFV